VNAQVANNLKAVELIKVEILHSLTKLFGDIIAEPDEGGENAIADDAANIITLTYLLSMRLGVNHDAITKKMKIKLKKSIASNHNLEARFGDLSELLGELGETV
jgi:hypothetical protein